MLFTALDGLFLVGFHGLPQVRGSEHLVEAIARDEKNDERISKLQSDSEKFNSTH
jgi:hypothetical protein